MVDQKESEYAERHCNVKSHSNNHHVHHHVSSYKFSFNLYWQAKYKQKKNANKADL